MAGSPLTRLCLVRLRYLAPLDELDVHRAAHVDWLKRLADKGALLLAGRTDPPTGGVLIFRGEKATVEPLAQTDPFIVAGLAQVEVVAFRASVTADAVAALL